MSSLVQVRLAHPGDIAARVLSPLPRSSAGLAGGWLLEAPGAGLTPGMLLTARLQGSGTGASGVLLPRGAVVRWNGVAWAYVATDATHFERRAVTALDGVPLRLVSQAASRRNITFVLRDADVPHAMMRLHETFF